MYYLWNILFLQHKGLNNKINKINHYSWRSSIHRLQRFTMSLGGLLAKDRSVIIHNWYPQQLVIEIFKVKVGISPVEKFPTFSNNNNSNLRRGTHLSRPILHTKHYGTEYITNLGAKKKEKNETPSLLLKTRLGNEYQKFACVVFVRHI